MFALALKDGNDSDRIDVIFDMYKDISIKNAERENRRPGPGVLLSNIVSGHKIIKWRSILACYASKTALITLSCDGWKKPSYVKKLGAKAMYVTCQEECFKLSRARTSSVPELMTSQEEADTWVLLHAKHASRNH